MADALETAIREEAVAIGAAATRLVYEQEADVFSSERMFTAPEEEGSELTAATPLRASTIRIKKAAGSRTPEVPRVRTGALMNSLRAQYGELRGEVSFDGEDGKVWYQQRTRPFVGVSRETVELIAREWDRRAELMRSRLAPVVLDSIKVSVAV
jgi:hypothetical protein